MKTALLFTGSGPIVIATSYSSLLDPGLIEKLAAKGIDKFIGHEIPQDLVRTRYAGHFDVAMEDLRETDDLHVIDSDGPHAFRLFHLSEFGPQVMYERA